MSDRPEFQRSKQVLPVSTITPVLTAVLVGVGVGIAAVGFRRLLEAFTALAFGPFQDLFSFLGRFSIVVVPVFGGLLTGPLIYYFARGAEGHGVPEVMEAVALHGGRIRPAIVVNAIGAIFTLGSGGSAGRVAPVVQIGSAIGSVVGQILKLPQNRLRNLVACGAAAGIAATFNAPIAGVFFALEVILGEIGAQTFSAIVLSSVVSSVIGRIFFGDTPAFLIPAYTLVSPVELIFYIGLGLLAASVATLFVKFLYAFTTFFDRLRFPEMLKPALGGLLVGLLGVLYPQVLGIGSQTIEAALHSRLPPMLLLVLIFLKLLATSLTLGSGGSGGVFGPSLVIGALLGGAYGFLIHRFFPGVTATPAAYALVGMAAVFAAAARAPITAVLILFEMSRNYLIILPLLLATVVGVAVASLLEQESVYTLKLVRRGVDVHAIRDFNLMEGITVDEAMTPLAELATVEKAQPLQELAQLLVKSHHHGFVVLDEEGKLFGIVTLSDLERAMQGEGWAERCVAEICTTAMRVAFPDETLEDALRHFGALDVGRIPVVSRKDPTILVGLLRRDGIIHAYVRASRDLEERRRRMELTRMQHTAVGRLVEFELKRIDRAVGYRILDLRLPGDCLLVSIRRGRQTVVPRGATRLLAGDRVILLADAEGERKVRRILRQGPTA